LLAKAAWEVSVLLLQKYTEVEVEVALLEHWEWLQAVAAEPRKSTLRLVLAQMLRLDLALISAHKVALAPMDSRVFFT
jgi:hypothetical protein